ncbi:MAG: hypothetical protein E7366_01675 [Clostridiales bacterium]|nr:hypothetical protein [Clostridiales bacterium]
MKKKILLLCLSLMAASSFAACDLFASQESSSLDSQNQSSETGSVDTGSDTESGDSSEAEAHVYVSHEAVEATCQAAGNEAYYTCEDCDKIFNAEKVEIQEIPVIAQVDHSYVLQNEVPGTCSTVGVLAHYTCDGCDTLFDLTKNEITSAAGELDEANHSADEVLVATAQPNKLAYAIGEEFDPTGMTVAYKCANCEGEVIDNQFLTYEYQTAGATAFANGDTKLIVKFDKLSFELAITVTKIQAEITNVEETYATTCGVAPTISALSNVPDAPIDVKYYEGDTEVTADQFAAGKSYTVKLSIASTDSINGTEKTANITVEHAYAWVDDASDWKKLNYVCKCGDAADFYAMNYQSPYVDANNLGVDLSAFVIGAQDVQIKSVKQIIRMKDGNYIAAKDGEVVDIAYTNEGSVYSFAADKYEQPSGDWKPYILTLSVVYAIGEVECPIVVEVKFIDKLIKTAEDLLSVRYMGDPGDSGAAAMYGYYVLADNIDASGVEITGTNPCWQAASGFRGTFEGNGYTISNLTVVGGQGLFGAIGDGAKIQNVTFDNVKVASGSYVLAFAIRTATLENVSVKFNTLSKSYYLAGEANSSTYKNVNVLTDKAEKLFINMGGNQDYTLPETITVSHFTEYTVSFDTNGGNAMEAVSVVEGRTLTPPQTPTKTSEEYNYVFLGWFKGEEKWNFDTPITGEMTLTAQWQEVAKTMPKDVITAIDALPETVKMPEGINYVAAIVSAEALYGELEETAQASVTNYAKLEKLLKAIRGYETVYVPNETGVKAIPGHSPDGAMSSTIPASGALSTDAVYGTTFKATSGVGGSVSIQFANFPDVAKYDTIYFYVRSTSAQGYLYISDDAENGGWGTNWKNNFDSIANSYGKNNVVAGAWNLISFDVSTGYFSDDWAITVWTTAKDYDLEIGAIVGYKAVAVTEVKTEVALEWGARADSGETNEYGKVYNISREQYYIDQNNTNTLGTLPKNRLANALAEGYEYLVFWMYNPTDTVYSFHLAGDCNGAWTDSKDSTPLAAKAWTKIVISAEDIALNTQGQWYVYIQGGDGAGAAKEGWKISTTYAVKSV